MIIYVIKVKDGSLSYLGYGITHSISSRLSAYKTEGIDIELIHTSKELSKEDALNIENKIGGIFTPLDNITLKGCKYENTTIDHEDELITFITHSCNNVNVPLTSQQFNGELFSANDIVRVGNVDRITKGLPPKDINEYLRLSDTKELLSSIAMELDCFTTDLIQTKRGRNGGHMVHPFVAIDLELWINPLKKLSEIAKYNVVKTPFKSGDDSYKLMMSELDKTHTLSVRDYPKISNRIKRAVGVVGDWNTATEEQAELRESIHKMVIILNKHVPYPNLISEAIKEATRDEFLN